MPIPRICFFPCIPCVPWLKKETDVQQKTVREGNTPRSIAIASCQVRTTGMIGGNVIFPRRGSGAALQGTVFCERLFVTRLFHVDEVGLDQGEDHKERQEQFLPLFQYAEESADRRG